MNAAELFHVEYVEITEAPDFWESSDAQAQGASANRRGSWYRYVVASRSSRVVGRFRGTVEQARDNAECLAASINERKQGNRSLWVQRAKSSRKTSAKAAKSP